VLFIHCLLKANYNDKKWHGIEIKRGSFITSLRTLSKETHLSIQQTRTSLDKLISTNEITNKSTSHYRVITIVNFNKYQTNNKQDNKQVTNNQQTDNKQVTTTIERVESIESIDREKQKKSSNIEKSSINILKDSSFKNELAQQFNLSPESVQKELDFMWDWLKSTGKRYVDYKAFARNWIRRSKDKSKDGVITNILNNKYGEQKK
jgi:hypothetical protein